MVFVYGPLGQQEQEQQKQQEQQEEYRCKYTLDEMKDMIEDSKDPEKLSHDWELLWSLLLVYILSEYYQEENFPFEKILLDDDIKKIELTAKDRWNMFTDLHVRYKIVELWSDTKVFDCDLYQKFGFRPRPK